MFCFAFCYNIGGKRKGGEIKEGVAIKRHSIVAESYKNPALGHNNRGGRLNVSMDPLRSEAPGD